jgi:hypothetical protein
MQQESQINPITESIGRKHASASGKQATPQSVPTID